MRSYQNTEMNEKCIHKMDLQTHTHIKRKKRKDVNFIQTRNQSQIYFWRPAIDFNRVVYVFWNSICVSTVLIIQNY